MQKKNDTQLYKRITALAMSGVLLATSVPLMARPKAATAGPDKDHWNPEPYFSEMAREEGATAWFLNDGSIAVKFPAAIGGETSFREQNKRKDIKGYVFEITALGRKNPDLTGDPEVIPETPIYKIMASAAEVAQAMDVKASMLTKTFKPGEIKLADGTVVTRDTDVRLNVRITAVDSENWFSEPMDTIVTDVPVFEYDAERYATIDETNPNAIREIVQFEGDALQTDSKITSFKGDGQHLEFVYDNPKPNAGATQTQDNKPSRAVGFRLYNEINSANPIEHHFDTTWTREAWDFYGAEEIWFWFDCSEVCLNNVSLRMHSNLKSYNSWADGTFEENTHDDRSQIIYSTKGFAEHADAQIKAELAKPVAQGGKRVRIQQADGGWKEVNLAGGEQLNFDHFKGYVRVPIEFFCSETDAKATARIDNIFNWRNDSGKAKIIIPETIVNPAGTCVNEAALMSQLYFKKGLWTSGVYNVPTPFIGIPGYNTQINKDRRIKYDPATQSFKEDNQIYQEENKGVDGKPAMFEKQGYFKAIEDIYSVGFAFDSTTNSKDHIFFFDSVMAYKPTGQYPANNLGGKVSDGEPVNAFYNQQKDRANIILDAIDRLILSPTWTDYKKVEYISDMIEGFSLSFGEKPGDPKNIFADTDETAKNGMTAMATELGRLETWKKYRKARALCIKYGTVKEVNGNLESPANADMTNLVPGIIDILENLPPRDWLIDPTPDQKTRIIRLYQAYVMLNRTQLEALGEEEAKACFDYFAILGKNLGASQNDFVVGKHLAEKPFLPFCDFEKAPIGMNQLVPRVEDDHHSYYGAETDVRHTKGVNIVSAPVGYINDKDNYLPEYAIPNFTDIHSATAVMRPNGFMGSKAPRIYIHTPSDAVNTLTVTRDGQNTANLTEQKKSGGCGANGYRLGDLAKHYVGDEATEPPLSLIFYVDFTELSEEFNMVVNIFTTNNDGTIVKLRPNLSIIGSDANRKFFLLDPATGNWELTHCAATQYHFNSTSSPEDKLDLNGYKGYVRIPLYHIKGGAVGATKLDETAEWLNNIFAIQIGVGGAGMQGKSFVIDNIGFTYSENIYGTHGHNSYESLYNAKANPAVEFEHAVNELDSFAQNQMAQEQNIKNAIVLYDGLTDHQRSLPSVKNAVVALQRAAKWANLDWDGQPHSLPVRIPGESLRPNAVDPFHGTILADPSITAEILDSEKMTYKRAPLTLESFRSYVKDAKFFPNKAKDDTLLNTKTEFNVRFPGYVIDPQDPYTIGKVDYAKLGFADKEQVDRLLLLFEYGFSRLSWADQMKFQKANSKNGWDKYTEDQIWNIPDEELKAAPDNPEFTEAWNVYKAAVRCRELEKTRHAVDQMVYGNTNVPQLPAEKQHKGIFSAYQPFGYIPEGATEAEPVPEGDPRKLFFEIQNRQDVENIYDKAYCQQPYYAKIAAKYGAVAPALKEVPASIRLFLINSKEYTFGPNQTVLSGLKQLQKEYTLLNESLNQVIAKNQLIESKTNPAGLWQNILRAIEDYTHLLPNFRHVGEVYTPIEHILRKFPIVKTATTPEAHTAKPANVDLYMTQRNNYTDKTVENSYQVTYAIDLSQIQADSENWLTFKPTAGVMKAAENLPDEVPYELTLNLHKVKRDAQGAVLETSAVVQSITLNTVDIKAAATGAPIGLYQIEPNLYGKDANGNSYTLEVEIASSMHKADIPVNSFYGEDTFVLDVQTKKGADFVPFENAKNPNYPSTIEKRSYTIAYAKEDSFAVTFPAETQVAWGNSDPVDVSYTVTTNIPDSASLSVMVDDSKAGVAEQPYQFLLNGTDSAYTLTYNPAGFATPSVFQGVLNNQKPQTACTMTIPQTEWKKGTGNYETTLTYTVTYTENSTPAPMPTPSP